jgi:hypothetical protein
LVKRKDYGLALSDPTVITPAPFFQSHFSDSRDIGKVSHLLARFVATGECDGHVPVEVVNQ